MYLSFELYHHIICIVVVPFSAENTTLHSDISALPLSVFLSLTL